MTATSARPLCLIAADIDRHWAKVNYAAKPYLDAMRLLASADDPYFEDDARGIIVYFLSNAVTWRGEDARRIKAELKAML